VETVVRKIRKRKNTIKYKRYAQIDENNIVQQIIFVPFEGSPVIEGSFIQIEKDTNIDIGDKLEIIEDKIKIEKAREEKKSWWKF
jgi:hypothetical protein